jgi:hypothetical protein
MYNNAIFLGLEAVPASEKDGVKMAAGVRWRFEITTEGEHKGKIAYGTGPVLPTENNRTGKLLGSMGIAPGKRGQQTSIKDLIGKRFNVVVGLSQGKKPIVEYAYPGK